MTRQPNDDANIRIDSFFHADTSTFTYLLTDKATGQAAIIDPVLDFDQKSGRTSTPFIDDILAQVAQQSLTLNYVLETHAHADHLTAADYIRQHSNAQIVIGADIRQVQGTFKKIFNEDERFVADGRQFDQLVSDGDRLPLGDSNIDVLATPGHTPARTQRLFASMAYSFLFGCIQTNRNRCKCQKVIAVSPHSKQVYQAILQEV